MAGAEPFLRQTDLFRSGQGGYHTYRIPSLIVAPDGAILAFCEARRNGSGDDGDIDLVLRSSRDSGASWTDVALVASDGEHTVGNACPVLDRDTGTIWLPFCRNNDRVYVMSSPDSGVTWSGRVDVTQDVKVPTWVSPRGVRGGIGYGTGPGHGVQTRSGRMIVPSWHNEGDPQSSHVVYSDDHGASWQLGPVLGEGVDECELVQTHDGSLYMNMRTRLRANRRAVAWSHDDGDSWSQIEVDESLVDADCQGSIERFTSLDSHQKNRVIFANDASSAREKLTVRVSYDECRSWTESRVLHAGPSAYSDLCVAPDMTICCLYERGEQHPYERLTFAQFNIEWLTHGRDELEPRHMS